METVTEAIDAVQQALSIYDIFIDRNVPWTIFTKSLNYLDKYRNELSTNSALLIAEIKVDMMNSIDARFHASQKIFEWATLTVFHLKLYIELFDGHDKKKFETQKQLLIDVLDKGIAQMNAALMEFEPISIGFDSVGEHLKALKRQHIPDKLSELKQFYKKLARKVTSATQNIIFAQSVFVKQIELVFNLKTQIQQTMTFTNLNERTGLRDIVINSAQSLIANCEDYRKRHTKKK